MTYVIDIDNTLCSNVSTNNHINAEPYINRIKIVNNLYNSGHIIKLFTARTCNENMNFETLTKNQLQKWGVKYHELIFGKPECDVYVDDKAINSQQFFNNSYLWE